MNILLLTNMGRTDSSPASGEFVRRQLSAITAIADNDFYLTYFEMPAKAVNANSPLKRYFSFFSIFFKQHVFSRKKYSILHVHFFFPTILLAIAYKLFRNPNVKIITTFHGNDIYYYKPFSWWYRWCFTFVDHTIFVTERLKQHFFKKNIAHSILCAGILPIFSVNTKPERMAKKYDFIFVGTLDQNKGTIRLKELIAAMPNSSAVAIVGSGTYENEIIKLTKTCNITYFNFCNAEQLVELYRQTKWLINLSYNESFGLVITEALSCGIPVIATKTDGSLSQVVHGVNGYIVEQDQHLISHFVSILTCTTKNTYNELLNRTQQGSDKFTLPYVAKKIKQIYLKVGAK